jgi:threonine synthase
MAAVRETDGAYIQVSDQEILAAISALARGCAVFSEPAGAAAYAGLLKVVDEGWVRPDERIVILVTGNGLKDVVSAMQAVEGAGTRPYYVAPDLEDLKQVMSRIDGSPIT